MKHKYRCRCGATFRADPKDMTEHDRLCLACFDLAQILAFADGVGKTYGETTLTAETALSLIRGVCRIRLGMDPKPDDSISTDLTMSCPFCEGTISASTTNDAVIHSMPLCETFEKEDALTFIKHVREVTVGG